MNKEIRKKLKNAAPKESEESQLKISVQRDQGSNRVREPHHTTTEDHEQQNECWVAQRPKK